jgi:hypothetical protein
MQVQSNNLMLSGNPKLWSGDNLGPDDTLAELAAKFDDNHINTLTLAVGDADLEPSQYNAVKWTFAEWLKRKGYDSCEGLPEDTDEQRVIKLACQNDLVNNPDVIPHKYWWREILAAPGWTFEGPHGQDPQP